MSSSKGLKQASASPAADAARIEVPLKGHATRSHRAATLAGEHAPCLNWCDADIAATAATLLAWHKVDPGFMVTLRVDKGWITLSGRVDWSFQRYAVEQDVRRLLGVTGVTSTIEIQPIAAASSRSSSIRSDVRGDDSPMAFQLAR